MHDLGFSRKQILEVIQSGRVEVEIRLSQSGTHLPIYPIRQ
jgi:hypothetical protein